jgi:hypothetical protein
MLMTEIYDNSHKERIKMMKNKIEQLINDDNILGELNDDSMTKFTQYKESFIDDKKDKSEIKNLIDWDDHEDKTIKTINIDFALTDDIVSPNSDPEKDDNIDESFDINK